MTVAESIPSPVTETDAGQPSDGIPELCAGLRRGDEAAYREFHRRYHARLLRLCLAFAAGDEHQGQETLQAVFLRVARHIKPLPNEAALWGWLVKLARSAVIDGARGRSRYARALRRWGEIFGRAEESTDDGLLEALDLALADLDPASRGLIEAKYFQGQCVQAIAQAESLTEKAVEGRLSRTRALLRERIAHYLKQQQAKR